MVYAVQVTGMPVLNLLGIGVIHGNSGVTVALFRFTMKMSEKEHNNIMIPAHEP